MTTVHPVTGKGDYRLDLLAALFTAMMLALPFRINAAGIADLDISNHVGNELIFDPVVTFNTIDVTTENGIVTLSGTTDHLLAKQRAARIAETVRGVRAVVNRIEIAPTVRPSGAALAKSVEKALRYEAATDSYEVSVTARDNGEITLSGVVDSWAERALAETVAAGVSGVTAVRNKIVVNPDIRRTDNETKPEIVKRLHWDVLVDDAMVDVRVDDGNVTLSGVVGSAAEKRRARQNAWVAGVRAVDVSGLKVERWARDEDLRKDKYVIKSDLEVREAVRDALIQDPRVHAPNLDVTVSNGVVTLGGIVDTIQARQSAVLDARNTVGVIGVNSLVKVRPATMVDDEKLATDVREALLRSPLTGAYEIKVSADNGSIHLDGSVDSYFEKAAAENIAFRAKGVTRVRNRLTIDYPDILVYDPYVYTWSIYDFPWYQGATVTGKSDWAIERDIKAELRWSPFVDAGDVEVSVEAGIATLTGTVDSISEYDAARENAFEGGAIGVINKIGIRLLNDRLYIGAHHLGAAGAVTLNRTGPCCFAQIRR